MSFYFNKDLELLPLHQLRKLQSERLIHQVRKVYHQVPYYKHAFDSHGIHPDQIKSIDDIHLLPFTKKEALRQEYPFGLLTMPRTELQRLHCSSGTTGKPIVVGYSSKDIELFSDVVARSLAAAGCRPGMLLHNAYGYGLFTGGLGIHYGAEKLGMTVLPMSGGATNKQIMLLKDFQADAITITPSYAITLAEALHRNQVIIEELNLKFALIGAEPWTEKLRTDIEKGLQLQATNIYGLSEIIGPGVAQEDVLEKGTGSYIWEDHFFPEVVDKDTGAPLPYGEQGVLVLTTLTKEAMPVMRYWTNDITSIYYNHSKNRTHIKMGPIVGRADDMLIIRGVNLFHTQVETILNEIDACSSNYQLEVINPDHKDHVIVKVEITPILYNKIIKETENVFETSILRTCLAQLQQKIKDSIGLSMEIQLLKPDSLLKSEGGKTKRINDLRKY